MSSQGTIVVQLSKDSVSGAEYVFNREIDSVYANRLYGEDRSQFGLGEQFHIAVNHSNNVTIDRVLAISGLPVTEITAEARSKTITQLFQSDDLDSPTIYTVPEIHKSWSSKYIGVAGSIKLDKNSLQQTVITGDIYAVPFMLKYSYTYTARLFTSYVPDQHLDDDNYNIAVVFYITVKEV